MFARGLEALLADEARKTGLAQRSPDDLPQRFESLRGYALLPRGREKNVKHLSFPEIVAGILSLATVKPGFAGFAAEVLGSLSPVGGTDASFKGSGTFGKAIERLLEDPATSNSLLEVRVSDSEIYTNSHGRATIVYRSGDNIFTAHYGSHLARSALEPGAEKTFNSRDFISSVVTEMVFYPPFFRRLANQLKREASLPPVVIPIDPRDEDEEARKEERAERLGLKPNSSFLNAGVDSQVTWPREETVVIFEGYKLILLPKTRENTTSVHIDLHGQRISSEDALTLMNRFLSLMTWCDDQFAICQYGWSGNPIPVAVRKRDLAFTTATHWTFDRKIPRSPEARKALAIYREARNAQQNYLISYAVLSYCKIVELRHKGKSEARTWFGKNYEALKQGTNLSREIGSFEKACGTEKPHDYLYRACRTAVAHANKPFSTDPDDLHELRRLHVAADILQALARRFIANELGVSDCSFDGT